MEMACVLIYPRVELFIEYGFLVILQRLVPWNFCISCIMFESKCFELVANSRETRWTLCLSIDQTHALFEALASAFCICLATTLMVRGHRFESRVR